jgi:hypothetical protein
MSIKTKSSSRPVAARPFQGPPAWLLQTPAWTTQERLHRIQAMSQRINGYVKFLCEVGNRNGTSAEARERVVVAFYERMVVLEQQLGQIQEDFQLE